MKDMRNKKSKAIVVSMMALGLTLQSSNMNASLTFRSSSFDPYIQSVTTKLAEGSALASSAFTQGSTFASSKLADASAFVQENCTRENLNALVETASARVANASDLEKKIALGLTATAVVGAASTAAYKTFFSANAVKARKKAAHDKNSQFFKKTLDSATSEALDNYKAAKNARRSTGADLQDLNKDLAYLEENYANDKTNCLEKIAAVKKNIVKAKANLAIAKKNLTPVRTWKQYTSENFTAASASLVALFTFKKAATALKAPATSTTAPETNTATAAPATVTKSWFPAMPTLTMPALRWPAMFNFFNKIKPVAQSNVVLNHDTLNSSTSNSSAVEVGNDTDYKSEPRTWLQYRTELYNHYFVSKSNNN